ncbi:MAG TPA: RND transporter, partial [Verrucomicrobiales bacterium]|nr:RND transporter [Verrucomicrobiales bacterium]
MSERRSMVAVFGLAVLAAGCAVRPPESRISKVSAGVPERWIASKAARAGIDQDWIKRFGDSQLVALVDESMKNNPDLRVAAE